MSYCLRSVAQTQQQNVSNTICAKWSLVLFQNQSGYCSMTPHSSRYSWAMASSWRRLSRRGKQWLRRVVRHGNYYQCPILFVVETRVSGILSGLETSGSSVSSVVEMIGIGL
ncbi:unnamed protein product [Macrosiphum euphorbiae]|uniref:Uncharacterized protein n=1 Tax=Macrosiphum euphorbiae TaxID=13131 RepID=A0AAV0VZV2_9HEMI|nr:unnamed protein product [Macrosiphum euphorbiae]